MREPGFQVYPKGTTAVEIPFQFTLHKDGQLLEEAELTTGSSNMDVKDIIKGWAKRHNIDEARQRVLAMQITSIRDGLRHGLPWHNH